MTVHSFHVFDRKGKTLFTKRYLKTGNNENEKDDVLLSEQRKLIFGMLFSLRELSSSLQPKDDNNNSSNDAIPGDIQLVKTGTTTLYNYETVSGLRFVLYTTAETSVGISSSMNSASNTSSVATPPTSGNLTPILTGTVGGASLATSSTAVSAVGNTTVPPGGVNMTLAPSGSNPNSMHGPKVVNTTHLLTSNAMTTSIRNALRHIYEQIWVTFVVRSPLYQPQQGDIQATTNFEASLDNYLKGMTWFR